MHGVRIFIITVSYAFIAINIFKVYRKQKTLKLNAINLEKKRLMQVGHMIKSHKDQIVFLWQIFYLYSDIHLKMIPYFLYIHLLQV